MKFVFLVFVFATSLVANDSDKNERKQEKTRILDVEIHMCDGRILPKGKMEISVPEKFHVIHDVEGLEFQKEVSIDDIDSIVFTSWKPELIEIKKDKGKVYRFSVSSYVITLTDSLELRVKKPPPEFLERFLFRNRLGATILYSYWIDLLQQNNTWYTGLSGPENGERNMCYKDVVKKIFFTREKIKEAREKKNR